MSTRSPDNGLLLPGIDGSNPLGFLAALGVLRVLTLRENGVKLSWRQSEGTWRPELFGIRESLPDLGAAIYAAIQNLDQSAWSIDKELPFLAERLRQVAEQAAKMSCLSQRIKADTVSAFGAECCREKKKVKKEEIEIFKDTSFRLVRSGDNQHNGLLEYAAFTLANCKSDQIQRAISSDWLYRDEKKSFRWDPAEDRGYALQWGDPSGDGALTERGANCLALFGMVCFPVIPMRGEAQTTGFGLGKPKQISFTWPIWSFPINLSTACSLLSHAALQHEQPDRLELAPLGVAAAYRCNRVMTSTYYANFTPSQRVA
jgi:hypothetical protein